MTAEEKLQEWLDAKAKRKNKIAKSKQFGIQTMNEDMQELKAEMAAPDGFHTVVRDIDRVCQDCQNFHGVTRKAGQHADHIIPQGVASYEEKTRFEYGTGVCRECNKRRDQKTHRAAMLQEDGILYQVRWYPEGGIVKRRRVFADTFGAWIDYDLPDHVKDGHSYVF